MFRSKYKIEGKKEQYYENVYHYSNHSKMKEHQNYNKNNYNLEIMLDGTTDYYDNPKLSPTSLKNLKRIANNSRNQKEINTSVINNSQNLISDRKIIINENIPSPKNMINKSSNLETHPNKNNPYNLKPKLNTHVNNLTEGFNDFSNKFNNGPVYSTKHFVNHSLIANNLQNDYNRYSGKLVQAEKFSNLNTVDQITNDNNYYDNSRINQIFQKPNEQSNLSYNYNKISAQTDPYNQKLNYTNNPQEELNFPIERNIDYHNNYYEQKNGLNYLNRKIIYNKGETINKQQNSFNQANICFNTLEENNSQNPRITLNINTSISSIANNNFKNFSTIIPNTTKNLYVSNENQNNLDKNNSFTYNSNGNLIRYHLSGKTNYSSRLNSASGNSQNNAVYEKTNNNQNRKGSVSVKSSTNKSIEKLDFNQNKIAYNNRKIPNANNNMSNKKSSSTKHIENEENFKNKKQNDKNNLSPSEKIVDIRKHLDCYYKNKQVENKNNHFKEYMTTHNDSTIKNILNDHNTGNNSDINSRILIKVQNTDSNTFTALNTENNLEQKRFDYKDFKEKVLHDYRKSKDSNNYSCHNNTNTVTNFNKIDNFEQENNQIANKPLNYDIIKYQNFNEINNQVDYNDNSNQVNYNFRKDLVYNQNLNTNNNILKNNYNNLNRELHKINNDLININPNQESVKSQNYNLIQTNKYSNYTSRGILKDDRTNNLNTNNINLEQVIKNNFFKNNSDFNNFEKERNEAQKSDIDDIIKPSNGKIIKANDGKNESTKGKIYNLSYQNSERKNNDSKFTINENINENLNTRERDVNSIMNFMNNLQFLNSSNENKYCNLDTINNNKTTNQSNYEGEYNDINNQIEYINERLKLNEMNRNFIMTKIDSNRIDNL